MRKKVFTYQLIGGQAPAAGDQNSEIVDSMVAEEDITIVGWDLHVNPATSQDINGVGVTEGNAILTMRGEVGDEVVGVLAKSRGFQYCSGGAHPTAGFVYPDKRMFPDGLGVSMKEGEAINLSIDVQNVSCPNDAFWGGAALVYYVKGSPSK